MTIWLTVKLSQDPMGHRNTEIKTINLEFRKNIFQQRENTYIFKQTEITWLDSLKKYYRKKKEKKISELELW